MVRQDQPAAEEEAWAMHCLLILLYYNKLSIADPPQNASG